MLDRLASNRGSRKPKRRVGRGAGSGWGKTCGRGQKGAGARSGSKRRSWYEGGQMPLARRLPKRGFTNIFREPRQVVNLADLGRFRKGSVVDGVALAKAGLVARGDRPVKVLARGKLAKQLTLRVTAISASARAQVEEAGGRVELVKPGAAGESAPGAAEETAKS